MPNLPGTILISPLMLVRSTTGWNGMRLASGPMVLWQNPDADMDQ